MTEEIGKRIRERTRIALSLGAATLFSEEAQRALSSAIAGMRGEGLGDYSLRSIRKGRLQYLSAMGASTPELLALTQHRSLATLRRYLGWGVEDKEAARLASERATKVRLAVEASRIEGGGCDTRHPITRLCACCLSTLQNRNVTRFAHSYFRIPFSRFVKG